jgi:hypothetical protein
VDTREEFQGHVDLKHGIILPRGEPPDSERLQILRPRWKKLAECSQYYPDPATNHPLWTGPPLHYKSFPK